MFSWFSNKLTSNKLGGHNPAGIQGVLNGEIKVFPVWLRNRLLSAGLEPVLSQTEKACIASNYRQFLRISK